MNTTQPPGFESLFDRPAFDHDRRRRVPSTRRLAGGQRAATAKPIIPTVSSVTRDLRMLRATWTSAHGCFELVVGSHSAGLQVRLRSWLLSGTELEECFVIHTLTEFEQWLANAPTKFDHPVGHDELGRFARGSLSQ